METINPLHIDSRNRALTSYEEDVLKSVGATSKLKIRAHRAAERVKSNANFKSKMFEEILASLLREKFRRYSTLKSYTDLHLREISGAPKVKSNPSIFIEMFLVHLLYPMLFIGYYTFMGRLA